MFETAELGRKLTKEEYATQVPPLRTELLEAQRALSKASFSVIVVVNGADGAGKSELVKVVTEWLDARFLETHAFAEPTEEMLHRPEFWRYWMALPPKGRLAIVAGSWYTQPIVDRVYGRIDDADLEAHMQNVNAFERALTDDGTMLLKIWIHISKEEQRRRLEKLAKKKETRWRVGAREWKNHRLYDSYRQVSERVLRWTSTGDDPWFVVEGTDTRHRNVAVGRRILDELKLRLDRRKESLAPRPQPPIRDPDTILDRLDLAIDVEAKHYETELPASQAKLSRLGRKLLKREQSAILVFEGWDASGKGSAIRRIIHSLDPRQYRVIPVAAPTDEEKAHHYLWRFWRHLPRLGRFTIYDRSWYGRVLVERVEGFARVDEWARAYKEINDFEEQLTDHGIVLVKFWLHISDDEQLRRFQERERIPWKQHKITSEDYRNREKRHQYEAAASEMIARTSTEFAPWTLVEANSKRYARLKVVNEVCRRLEESLG